MAPAHRQASKSWTARSILGPDKSGQAWTLIGVGSGLVRNEVRCKSAEPSRCRHRESRRGPPDGAWSYLLEIVDDWYLLPAVEAGRGKKVALATSKNWNWSAIIMR
jgi:hypothetical protein